MARVLVVDDELDIREAVTEVLSYEGHEVFTASEGAEALRKCQALQPDLVLLDLMMPGMNGWEFRLAQLRDPAIAEIPVVVLSALGRVSNIDALAFCRSRSASTTCSTWSGAPRARAATTATPRRSDCTIPSERPLTAAAR